MNSLGNLSPRVTVRSFLRSIAISTSLLLVPFLLLTGAGPRSSPATQLGLVPYYIDNTNAACSNAGPGTIALPYCTISGALAAHPGPGNQFIVLAGTYREQILMPSSGAAGAPIVIEAANPSVTVDGTNDFGSPALWAPVSGDVWLAATVVRPPKQVFADNVRLTPTTVAPATMPPGTFQHVVGVGLYVNAGAGNPSGHAIQVGARDYGFYLSGRSFVTIQGFTVRRVDDRAIYFTTGSNDCQAIGNRTFENGLHGIQVRLSSNAVIRGNVSADNASHGIAITEGSSGCTIEDNESMRNVFPPERRANGIYLFGSPGNVLRRNRAHHNQDSGIQIQSGSNNTLSIQNQSWANGDHGFDNLLATGNLHIGCVAFGNFRDGFSIEGTSTGTQVFNSILADNGLTTAEYDLFVDPGSVPGFVSNFNVIRNSTAAPPVKFNSVIHPTLAGYVAASGQDVSSSAADPRFVDPVNGDFHLLAGSSAIDGASSGIPNWPPVDAEGRPPLDDPFTANLGAGPVPFADRGAFEYVPPQPPVAALNVTPPSGTAPLAVTADATGSTDPDDDIATYRFDFGDGTVVGPQASPTATHTFAAGTWTVRVTVTDATGLTGAASQVVTVAPPTDRPPVVLALKQFFVIPGTPIAVDVLAFDPDGDPIQSLTADLSDLPAGNNAKFVVNSSNTHGRFTWTAPNQKGNFRITFTARNALTGQTITHVHVKPLKWKDVAGLRPDAADMDSEDSEETLPARIALSNAAPNPARGSIALRLDLPRDTEVGLTIVDVQGRAVWSENRSLEAGSHTLTWDGSTTRGIPAGAGVYLARVQVGNLTLGRRFVRL